MPAEILSFEQICNELLRLEMRIQGSPGVVSVCNQAYELGRSARSRLASFSDENKEPVRQLIENGMNEIMNATRGSLYQYQHHSHAMRSFLEE